MIKAIVLLSLIAIGYANLPLAPRWGGYGGPGLVGAPGLLGAPAILAGPGLIGDSLARPTPYAFGYDTNDEYGTQLTRQESGDGNGNVKGSYSYRDAQGLSRVVEYIADGAGYRANVKTNEPGTETSAPADVLISSSAPVVVGPKLLARPALGLGLGLRNALY